MVAAARALVLSALVAFALGDPARSRKLRVHESRRAVPTGFSFSRAAAPDTILKLRIGLVSKGPSDVEQLLYDVSTPSSANYGKHLSKDEVKQLAAPAQESMDAVNAWLAENGISASGTSFSGDWIALDVTAKKANDLFAADYSVFTNEATGEDSIRTLAYSIPEDLQSHIDVVLPGTSFGFRKRLGPVLLPVDGAPVASAQANDVPRACTGNFNPNCLQELYGIPAEPATQPSNKIGVTGYLEQYANLADLKQFVTQFRQDISPDSVNFTVQTLAGGKTHRISAKRGSKDVDLQYTVGLATNVPTTFISVGNDTQDDVNGLLDTVDFLLAQDAPPQVLTTSYGDDEELYSVKTLTKLCVGYALLGLRSVSVLFGSGDGGVEGLGHDPSRANCTRFRPTFPGACPYITSVGGTQDVPEIGWYNASGGFSDVFHMPDYQQAAVGTYLAELGDGFEGRFNATGRAYPDVAAPAWQYDMIYQGGHITMGGGTSTAGPVFASVVALLNDRLAAVGRPSLGFLNPWLYSAAGAFNDITSGSNPGCGTDGFPAKEGWDPIIGLGTPSFSKLLAAAGL